MLGFKESQHLLVGPEDVHDVVDVRVDQLCPGLPQGMHNIADKSNLQIEFVSHQFAIFPFSVLTWDFSVVALLLSHIGEMSRPASLS